MTVRIFIGTDPNGCDAESLAACEWSIRKHASEPVEIVLMRHSADPESFWYGWDSSGWATPFSSMRFGIASYCGFKGKGLYCDSDTLWMADCAELWRQEIPPGKVVLAKGGGSWRLCVSLWSCEAAKGVLPPIEVLRRDTRAGSRANTLLKQRNLIAPFSGDWNCLDGEGYDDLSDSRLKVLHYTNMACQPSSRHALKRLAASGQKHWYDGKVRPHPRPDVEALFDRLLAEAEDAGYRTENYVPVVPFGSYSKRSLVAYRGAGR